MAVHHRRVRAMSQISVTTTDTGKHWRAHDGPGGDTEMPQDTRHSEGPRSSSRRGGGGEGALLPRGQRPEGGCCARIVLPTNMVRSQLLVSVNGPYLEIGSLQPWSYGEVSRVGPNPGGLCPSTGELGHRFGCGGRLGEGPGAGSTVSLRPAPQACPLLRGEPRAMGDDRS